MQWSNLDTKWDAWWPFGWSHHPMTLFGSTSLCMCAKPFCQTATIQSFFALTKLSGNYFWSGILEKNNSHRWYTFFIWNYYRDRTKNNSIFIFYILARKKPISSRFRANSSPCMLPDPPISSLVLPSVPPLHRPWKAPCPPPPGSSLHPSSLVSSLSTMRSPPKRLPSYKTQWHQIRQPCFWKMVTNPTSDARVIQTR